MSFRASSCVCELARCVCGLLGWRSHRFRPREGGTEHTSAYGIQTVPDSRFDRAPQDVGYLPMVTFKNVALLAQRVSMCAPRVCVVALHGTLYFGKRCAFCQGPAVLQPEEIAPQTGNRRYLRSCLAYSRTKDPCQLFIGPRELQISFTVRLNRFRERFRKRFSFGPLWFGPLRSSFPATYKTIVALFPFYNMIYYTRHTPATCPCQLVLVQNHQIGNARNSPIGNTDFRAPVRRTSDGRQTTTPNCLSSMLGVPTIVPLWPAHLMGGAESSVSPPLT